VVSQSQHEPQPQPVRMHRERLHDGESRQSVAQSGFVGSGHAAIAGTRPCHI
jgi:hypothetical protein